MRSARAAVSTQAEPSMDCSPSGQSLSCQLLSLDLTRMDAENPDGQWVLL